MFEVISIKDVKVKIGLICRARRETQSLSKDELANALSISRTTIQNIENGKNSTLDNLLKVANHFRLLELIYKSMNDLDS